MASGDLNWYDRALSEANKFTENGCKVYCRYLIRDNTKSYFDNILKNKDGDMITNDRNEIRFCASVRAGSKDGEPIENSFYGSTRLLIPVELLVCAQDSLYFTSFYNNCITLTVVKNNSYHYMNKSRKLSWVKNNFFCYDQNGKRFLVTDSCRLHINLVFTDKINIPDLLKKGAKWTKVVNDPRHLKSELQRILKRAQVYTCSSEKVVCNELYRNNVPEYFYEIFTKKNSIMEKKLKDQNGDPRSPINDRIEGLFFCANVKNGKPIDSSPFGTSRLSIPVNLLIDQNKDRLYFADFYCIEGSKKYNHYIILVVEKYGSEIYFGDLPELSLTKNEFFNYDEVEQNFVVVDCPGIYIEIFYTDSIDIGKMFGAEWLSLIQTVDEFGQFRCARKKLDCSVCNPDPPLFE